MKSIINLLQYSCLVAKLFDSFATPWTVAHEAPVHGIFRARIPEWIAISFSQDLPHPGVEPASPALIGRQIRYHRATREAHFSVQYYVANRVSWIPRLTLLDLWTYEYTLRMELICLYGTYCSSLIIGNVEHLFTYLLVICMSSLEKCLLKSFTKFLSGINLLYWVVWVVYILDINPMLNIWFENIFLYSVDCLFILLMVTFTMHIFCMCVCFFD